MPARPSRPCAHPGCRVLLANGEARCDKHRAQQRQATDERRGSSAERGYGGRWQQARASYLRRNPLCCYCERAGRIEPATVVDHVTPHRGDASLFWSQSNWQSLCKRCHDSTKQREERAEGRGGSNLWARPS